MSDVRKTMDEGWFSADQVAGLKIAAGEFWKGAVVLII
jgi:hypothetical protein